MAAERKEENTIAEFLTKKFGKSKAEKIYAKIEKALGQKTIPGPIKMEA